MFSFFKKKKKPISSEKENPRVLFQGDGEIQVCDYRKFSPEYKDIIEPQGAVTVFILFDGSVQIRAYGSGEIVENIALSDLTGFSDAINHPIPPNSLEMMLSTKHQRIGLFFKTSEIRKNFADVYNRVLNSGLDRYGEQQFHILVQINGERVVKIPLLGKQGSLHALRFLLEEGYLDRNMDSYFTDWPKAKFAAFQNACVYELDENAMYHVHSEDEREMRTLYGCPTPRSFAGSGILNQVEIQVVDYEK